MWRSSTFLITDSINQTRKHSEIGDTETAYNYASLVMWRIDYHKSWLTDGENIFITHCLQYPPKKKRSRN